MLSRPVPSCQRACLHRPRKHGTRPHSLASVAASWQSTPRAVIIAPTALPTRFLRDRRMAMQSVAELLDALNRCPVLDEAQRKELAGLAVQFPEVLDLSRELVRREWLTVYQLKQVFQGR